MKIIIPTKGRANIIHEKTLRLFPDATLCIGEVEAQAYGRHNSNLPWRGAEYNRPRCPRQGEMRITSPGRALFRASRILGTSGRRTSSVLAGASTVNTAMGNAGRFC